MTGGSGFWGSGLGAGSNPGQTQRPPPVPASTDDGHHPQTLRETLMRRYVAGVGRERFYPRGVFPAGGIPRDSFQSRSPSPACTSRERHWREDWSAFPGGRGSAKRYPGKKEGHVHAHTKGLSEIMLASDGRPPGSQQNSWLLPGTQTPRSSRHATVGHESPHVPVKTGVLTFEGYSITASSPEASTAYARHSEKRNLSNLAFPRPARTVNSFFHVTY